jgi:hypothetical protein
MPFVLCLPSFVNVAHSPVCCVFYCSIALVFGCVIFLLCCCSVVPLLCRLDVCEKGGGHRWMLVEAAIVPFGVKKSISGLTYHVLMHLV